MNGRRGKAFEVDYPLCSYGHICWLLNLKKMLRCEWGWNSLWQEHALAARGPSLQAVLLSANTRYFWKQTYFQKMGKILLEQCWWPLQCVLSPPKANIYFSRKGTFNIQKNWSESFKHSLVIIAICSSPSHYYWLDLKRYVPRRHTFDTCIIWTISCVWNVFDVCEVVVLFASVGKVRGIYEVCWKLTGSNFKASNLLLNISSLSLKL